MKNLIILFFSFLCTAGHTQSPHTSPVTRAVVVGISDYQDPGIPDLNYAHIDAEVFANWLHQSSGMQIPLGHIQLLLNEEATLGKFSAAIDWLLEESREGDQAIIYFSGHGDMEAKILNQLGFLLLWDSPAKAYIAGALPVDMLKQVVTTLSTQQKVEVLLIADACRSGKLAGNNIIGTQLTNANMVKQFAKEQKILSCQADEYSIEGEQWGGGRGAFSWYLINGLSGKADGNDDHSISLLEIERFLQDHVTKDVEPLSQIPLTVGDKKTAITKVDEALLASVSGEEPIPAATFSIVHQRGIAEDVLEDADSSIISLYFAFVEALEHKRLLEPVDSCAETYYKQLIQIESIKSLHHFLTRNLAATFQEDAQQAINAYLNADQEELNQLSRWDDKYRLYPLYLEKSADLLGPDNHMYTSLKARQYYFEALYTRLFFDVVNTDTLFHSAVKKLERSLELEPNAPYVYQELGLLYDRRLDKEKAESYFRKAMELSPSWIIPYKELADILSYTGRTKEGYDLFKKAFPLLESKGGHLRWVAYKALASCAGAIGKKEEAERLLREYIDSGGSDGGVYNYLASMLRAWGQLQESEDLLKKGLEVLPGDWGLYQEMALTKHDAGKVDEFIDLHEKALRLAPYRAYDYLRFIHRLLNSNRINKAVEWTEKLFQLDPAYRSDLGNTSSWDVARRIFHNLGRQKEADQFANLPIFEAGKKIKGILSFPLEGHSKQAIAEIIDKYNLDPHQLRRIGQYLYLKREPEKAAYLFQLAFNKAPNDLNLIRQIGDWYWLHGDYEPAVKYLQLGIDAEKSDFNFFLNLTLVYFYLEEYQKALEVADAGMTAFPDAPPFLSEFKAVILYFIDPGENSKAYFEEIEKVKPGFLKIWEFLESIRQENYQEAVVLWEEIKEFLLSYPVMHFYIGALMQTGNIAATAELLKDADKYGGVSYRLLATHHVLEGFRKTDIYKSYVHQRFPEKFEEINTEVVENTTSAFPYQGSYYRLIGLYHRYKDRPEIAIPFFEKSLEVEPQNNETRIYLAELYLKTQRYKDAEAISPETFLSDGLGANYVAGEVFYKLGRSEEALKHFQEFIRLSNGYRFPNNKVGAFYRRHGEFDLAKAFLEEDIRLHPDDKTFPPSDCRCETNLLKKETRLHPTNLTSRLNLALLHFFSDDLEPAYAVLNESIRREPGQLALRALKAFIRYFEDPAASKRNFGEANGLAPGFKDLWNTLELMRTDQLDLADIALKEGQQRFSDWWMEIIRYHYLLMQVRQGNTEEALDIFETLLEKEVFVSYPFLEKAEGLKPLRKEARYKELMKKYFPEKG